MKKFNKWLILPMFAILAMGTLVSGCEEDNPGERIEEAGEELTR